MDSAMESESEVESETEIETGIGSERQSDGESAIALAIAIAIEIEIETESVSESHSVMLLLASARATLIETSRGCVAVSGSVHGRGGVIERTSDPCAHARESESESESEIQHGCHGHAGHPRCTALARTKMDTTGMLWQLQYRRQQSNLTDDQG